MIFGRILKSLKSGNWSVAFIELVMIVVGIIIAFQVDQWNEDRKAGIGSAIRTLSCHSPETYSRNTTDWAPSNNSFQAP